jgi:single-strand DNA-binding protein
MSNPNNVALFTGNLASEPAIFVNKDGSKTVLTTIYTKNNFKSKKTGQVESKKVTLKDYIPAGREGNGIYDWMHTGDEASFSATADTESYTNREGKVIYEMVLLVDSVVPRESKRESAERAARRNTGAQGAQGQAPVQQGYNQPQGQVYNQNPAVGNGMTAGFDAPNFAQQAPAQGFNQAQQVLG